MAKVNEGSAFCKLGSHLPSLDFAGLSALVGSNISKAGISYTCLVRGRLPYLSAYVTPGTLGLGQAVLSCIDWRPARILVGAGEAGSMLELCGVQASGNANYVGLQSGTALNVRGVVGEAVVSEIVKTCKKPAHLAIAGRDSGRHTCVIWAVVRNPDAIVGEICVEGEQGALINIIATLICVVVLALDAWCRQWFGFLVVATGMMLNAMMAYLLRMLKFEIPEANPAADAPVGDSVILLKDKPDVLFVLVASEKAVQKLLQKEVKMDSSACGHPPLPLVLVCMAFIAYAALLVLGIPHMGSTAQLLFIILVCVGAVTDLIKGSWNGKRGIGRAAIKKYQIEIESEQWFGNRTAAVASVAAKSTKLDALQESKVLPTTGPVWRNWWKALEILGHGQNGTASQRLNSLKQKVPDKDRPFWDTLIQDMKDGHDKTRIIKVGAPVANQNNINQCTYSSHNK